MGNAVVIFNDINNTLNERLLPCLAREMREKIRSDQPWSCIRGLHRTPVKILKANKKNKCSEESLKVCSISCWRSANSRLKRELTDLAHSKRRRRRTRMQLKYHSIWVCWRKLTSSHLCNIVPDCNILGTAIFHTCIGIAIVIRQIRISGLPMISPVLCLRQNCYHVRYIFWRDV